MYDMGMLGHLSLHLCVLCHGSVLGPILFIMYIADLILVIEIHGLSPHMYADDIQVMVLAILLQLMTFYCDFGFSSWMKLNMLSLNCNKTEVLSCETD